MEKVARRGVEDETVQKDRQKEIDEKMEPIDVVHASACRVHNFRSSALSICEFVRSAFFHLLKVIYKETMKLTTLFTACRGRRFLARLSTREGRNYEFDFFTADTFSPWLF